MNKLRHLIWILFLLAAPLAFGLACSLFTSVEPSALEVSSTEIAAQIFATQTAQALAVPATTAPPPTALPTDTPQPTDTPVPTDTPTATPRPTATPTPRPSNTPLPTSTREPDLVVTSPSINLRSGPGLAYTSVGVMREGDTATVIGQAYDCGWLLVRTPAGDEGWVTGGSEYVDFNLACATVAEAVIPPTPTSAASPTVPASATPDNRHTVRVLIENDTGGPLIMYLNGPAVYNFTVAAGDHYIEVVPGSYSYSVTGCGGAVATGTIHLDAGDVWTWYCE